MYIADLSSVRYKYGVRGVSQTKFTMSDSFLVFYDFDILSMIKEKSFWFLLCHFDFKFVAFDFSNDTFDFHNYSSVSKISLVSQLGVTHMFGCHVRPRNSWKWYVLLWNLVTIMYVYCSMFYVSLQLFNAIKIRVRKETLFTTNRILVNNNWS